MFCDTPLNPETGIAELSGLHTMLCLNNQNKGVEAAGVLEAEDFVKLPGASEKETRNTNKPA